MTALIPAPYIVIEVINNNSVFSAIKLAALKEQIQQYLGNAGAGRGLGLYLVCYFVKQCKGSLSVESSVQNGVKFIVKIPNAA